MEAKAGGQGPIAVQRGKEFQASVQLRIKDGFHINSNAPGDKYLIPLRVTWESGLVETGRTEFPEGKKLRFPFASDPVSVYEGEAEILQTFTVKPDAARGFSSVTGTLRYQACNDSECYPPATARVRLAIDVR